MVMDFAGYLDRVQHSTVASFGRGFVGFMLFASAVSLIVQGSYNAEHLKFHAIHALIFCIGMTITLTYASYMSTIIVPI
jgi:hypothetical protein